MPLLSFISDQDLEKAVSHLLVIAHEALQEAEREFNKNVIGPFAALFEIAGFQIDETTWHINEKARKAQKSLQGPVSPKNFRKSRRLERFRYRRDNFLLFIEDKLNAYTTYKKNKKSRNNVYLR